MIKLIKYTIAGGVLFLLPIVVLGLVVSKAFNFLSGIVRKSNIAEFAGPVARAVIVIFILFQKRSYNGAND